MEASPGRATAAPPQRDDTHAFRGLHGTHSKSTVSHLHETATLPRGGFDSLDQMDVSCMSTPMIDPSFRGVVLSAPTRQLARTSPRRTSDRGSPRSFTFRLYLPRDPWLTMTRDVGDGFIYDDDSIPHIPTLGGSVGLSLLESLPSAPTRWHERISPQMLQTVGCSILLSQV